MKYLICGDVHWSSYSSIVRSRGKEFSTRLENLINTINWVEQTAVEEGCQAIIYLGDFFDKSDLNSEEITALKRISWSNLHHWFLVGNHEMGISSLQYSSAHLFLQNSTMEVIDKPYSVTTVDNVQLCFLPYILESDRKTLNEYFGTDSSKRVVFSHNDLKGVQMGKFLSTEGFDIQDIDNNCRIFFNGHLHNESIHGYRAINIGNITGQNFSEDGLFYRHKVVIFDDTEFSVNWYENPHAFNFYKLDMTTYRETVDDDKAYKLLSGLGPNAIVTVKTFPDEKIFYEDMLSNLDNILTYRLIYEHTEYDSAEERKEVAELASLDHIEKFEEFVRETIGEDDIILEELSKVVQA